MKPFLEFSKWFIKVAVYTWIIGAVFGAIIIGVQTFAMIYIENSYISMDLSGYLMYIATPLTGGIIGYMGKAAFENREKIIRSFKFKQEGDK